MTAERDRLLIEAGQLKAQIVQLKSALDKWTAAVKDRDAALKHAGDLVQSLAKERNNAIQKFNDLADKYNALVTQVQASQRN